MLHLHDTLTGELVEFVPRTPGKVSLYACGPTVYDHPHLGHARQALTYDMARRYLEWSGFEVHHVANITDIDDNIIQRAQREGRSESEVATEWEAIYIEAMEAIDILHPHDQPHATDYVEQMVDLIKTLVDNGSAYSTDAGVYLRVRSVADYGALVHRSHDELAEGAGARVEVDTNKEDPLDFALWKTAKPGEPTWPSPWGDGRPGWHIECAAMSLGILGDGFDLHGGGDDLVFPHHTNERAEAIAAGREFSRYWMHNAMVNIGGEKMSKSLNNFTTLQDLLDEHPLNSRALRLLLLQTHYRKTLEINSAAMAQAREGIKRLDAMCRKALAAGVALDSTERDANAVADFRAAMDSDFGTPGAMSVVFEVVRKANGAIDGQSAGAATFVATAVELAAALGLRIGASDGSAPEADHEIEKLVEARSEAKVAKDWTLADQIRDELTTRGVTVEDTPDGPIWYRNT